MWDKTEFERMEVNINFVKPSSSELRINFSLLKQNSHMLTTLVFSISQSGALQYEKIEENGTVCNICNIAKSCQQYMIAMTAAVCPLLRRSQSTEVSTVFQCVGACWSQDQGK